MATSYARDTFDDDDDDDDKGWLLPLLPFIDDVNFSFHGFRDDALGGSWGGCGFVPCCFVVGFVYNGAPAGESASVLSRVRYLLAAFLGVV